jgi:hypothetical protein
MGGHTKSDAILFTAMPIIYDMQGYPHFVVDLAERRPDGARKTVQAAMLLVRSFFDEGEQRMTSIDDIDIGTPANGWTIRFTGVTGAQPPEAYIATYRNGQISYNEDPNRQAASMSERVWYAVDFAKGKGGSKGSGKTKNCTKGKLCGGSCIAKGRNCRIEANASQKKAADALSKTNAEDAAKAKAAVKKEKTGEKAAKQKGKPIESYGDFRREVARIYDKINTEESLNDLVPIYRIRRELGDRVSREQFKEWMMDIQADDKIQLMGGQVPGVTQDQREDSITIPGGGLRFYARKLQDFGGDDESDATSDQSPQSRRGSKPRTTAGSKPKPKTTPIKSYDDFKSEIASTYDRLNKDYNLGDLVPIHRLRRELGNRVSRDQFDKWLVDIQADDNVQLMGGALTNATQSEKDDALKIRGALRFYVRKLKDF